MVRYRMVKPFLEEFAVFVFVLAVFTATVKESVSDFIFRTSFLSVASVVIIFLAFLALCVPVFNMGLRALYDFVFQKTKVGRYIFLEQTPYKASVFSEKTGRDFTRSLGMYYLLQMKCGEEICSFLSSSFLELEKGQKYQLVTGAVSHIVLECFRL